MADAQTWVTATKGGIRRLGGSFMKSPETRLSAAELGLPGFVHYFRGRSGVLGPVSPDVVAAVFGFFQTDFLRSQWNAVTPELTAHEHSLRYARACHDWGRRCLADFAPAGRLAELLEHVVDRADVPGAPLFAGWRAAPRPDDAPARVAQLAQLLREHRGGLHLAAVLATGLRPVEAILTRDDGPRRAGFLGWAPPHPPIGADVRARRAEAEILTDRLAASAYTVLRPARRAELARLLREADRAAMARHRPTAAQRPAGHPGYRATA